MFSLKKGPHLDNRFQDDNNSVPSQSNRLDGSRLFNLNDRTLLQVIPDQNFVGWVLWLGTTSDQSQIVASEQHFNMANASINEVLVLFLPQWVAVVDTETIFCSTGKAALQVERNI